MFPGRWGRRPGRPAPLCWRVDATSVAICRSRTTRTPHDRHASPRKQRAEAGHIAAIVPQFVVFETTYVLQSQYGITGERLASVIRDVVTTPGVQTIDTCPWRRVLELWPNPFPGLADASIVAVATTNRYDAIATFDQKLAKRAKDLGVASYW